MFKTHRLRVSSESVISAATDSQWALAQRRKEAICGIDEAQNADRLSDLLRRPQETAAEEARFASWLDDVVERGCDPMTAARRLIGDLE